MAGEIGLYQNGNIVAAMQHPPIGTIPIQTTEGKWEWVDLSSLLGSYYHILKEQVLNVSLYRQHLITGDLKIEGEVIIKGELVQL